MHGFWNGFCNGYPWMSRWSWGGGIMMLIGLLLVVLVIYLLFRKKESGTDHSADSALEMLKRRFVNGEISREEFEEKKRILTES